MSPKVLALSQAKIAVMYLFTILLSKAMDLKSIVEGDRVSFDTEKSPKGPSAINVVKQ